MCVCASVQVCSWTIKSFKKLSSLRCVLLYILVWEFWRSDDEVFWTDLFSEAPELQGSASGMLCGSVVRNADSEGAEQAVSWYSVISEDVKPYQPTPKPQAGIPNGHLPVSVSSVWRSMWNPKALQGCNFSFLSSVIWLLWLEEFHQAGENMLPVSLPSCIYISSHGGIHPIHTHTCGGVTSESHSSLRETLECWSRSVQGLFFCWRLGCLPSSPFHVSFHLWYAS